MGRLEGQTAIVTGAGRGIGRAVAAALAKEGAAICAVARHVQELAAVVEEIREQGGKALALAEDVRRFDQVQPVVPDTTEAFDGVDFLVNNAGVAFYGTVAEIDPEKGDLMLDTNFKGTACFSKAVLPTMLAKARGRIINIASVAGLHGMPMQAGYWASKFAVVGFAQALSQEVASRGILVTTLCPGGTNTSIWEKIAYPNGDCTREDLLPREVVAELVVVAAALPNTVVFKEAVLFPPHEWH